MGWAKENLSAPEREAIARELFKVTSDKTSSWLHGLCPIHGEKNSSFGYNIEEDFYNCFSCGAGGDLVALFTAVNHLDKSEGFKKFRELYGRSDTVKNSHQAKKPTRKNSIIPESVWEQMKPLPAEWIKRLQEIRGWTPEIIKILDLRLQTVYRTKKGEIQKVRKPERIAIPIRDADGRLVNIRLYKPGAKQSKIISWAKEYGSARLFPPVPDPKGPVILCEGEPDTIIARGLGLNAITQTSKTRTWSTEHLKPFNDREVVIAYDADRAGQRHADNAAKSLHKVAASVRLLEWPEYMGRQADGSWPADHGQDLSDFFVRHGKTLENFQELLSRAEVYEPPPEDGPGLGSERQFFTFSINGRLSFKPRLLANRILKDIPLLSDPMSGQLYRWSGDYWEEYNADLIRSLALQYLGKEANKSRVEDATYQARMLSTIPHGRFVNDQEDWVCVQNGMLNLCTYELKPHSHDYFATVMLGVNFNPKSTGLCERWLQYLEESVQTERAIMQLQEFAGYCLTRDTRYGKCLLLVGPGSDGKSTFLKMLRELVGPQNCAAVSFQDLEDQFYRSSLYNKLLNISTEVGSRALESPIFKAIITGDPISAAFKHQNPFEFSPYCKLAFAANKLPRVLDNSDGFFRRMLPIRFKKQFLGPDADIGLLDILQDELSEIFLWALAGLQRLREQGGFTECEETSDLLMKYRRLNNPVLCFVEDKCDLGSEYDVNKDDLYVSYREYCRDSGYSPNSRENFFRELQVAVNNLKEYRPRVGTKRMRAVKGIRIKISEG